MAPEFAHVVRINEDSWDLNYLHPVAWCRKHVPQHTWSFHLDMDPGDPDSDESYVFSFEDAHAATQFALLFS